MNLRNKLAKQFLIFLCFLTFVITLCIFVSSTYMDFVLKDVSSNSVPIKYQIQFMVMLGVICLLAVVMVAFIFGKLFGSPLLHISSWLQNLANNKLEEPKGNKGIPASQRLNGQLKQTYKVYDDVIADLHKLTATLKSSDLERKKLEKTREEWMTGISHDLKTPISVVKGYATLLANKDYRWSSKEIREFSSIIHGRMDYMERLVEDFNLTFQLKNDALPMKLELCNLVELVRQAIVDIANDPQVENQYEFSYEPTLEAIYRKVDPKLFKRAMINLISNAVKHNSPGTIIRISIQKKNNNQGVSLIHIIVQDNGIGMDKVTIKNLFNRYYIGSDSPERKGSTGLGMTISNEIIQAHGGKIEVNSILDEGTTCTISLIE
ncbi:sensor histidine kinase [Priestia megaterium]|uniref:sensor histidine kinase n=1 Tax=Priestia megaterium TaxID=1404 RepID=UPI001D49346C|nr:HAMP domain-containing sensor histidine kinase [Priestia megaterium]CAH0324299.1 Sensor histidine kinase WalK [Priestia megaterium]